LDITMSDRDIGAGWRQVNLCCDDWQAAELMAVTHLGSWLTKVADSGEITIWWFVRKGREWRLRFLPADGCQDGGTAFVDQMTTALVERAAIRSYAEVIYEPEIHAFGGAEALALAHDLFHADSRHILAHLAHAQVGMDHRRELGLRLSARLMRAAGQDWYEQGDIWSQVAAHRTTGADPQPSPVTVAAVQRLVAAIDDSCDSPLASAPEWSTAFERAGQALAELAQQGKLTRGLRAVLAHHVLFAFNRLGISAQHQHALAAAAGRVVFQREILPDPAMTSGTARHRPTEVNAVTAETTETTDTPTAGPEQLRENLVAFIDRLGTFRTPQVRTAFQAVPRQLFLPGVDLATAYAPQPVVTKRADDGTALSSASGPNVVATMLEQLNVQLGHRVLEIGAATGINAALLAELVGPAGTVITIELDEDLAAGARANLAAAGYDQVKVIRGDGALGYPAGVPYDRIIVTTGAWDIVCAWWQQLAVGGRLVVPLRLHGSGLTRSIAFDRDEPDRMVSDSAAVCGFVPMRGTAEKGECHVRLADDVILKLEADDLPDSAALAQALTYPGYEQWTGLQVRHDEPAEHLDLWLATTTNGASFGRLSAGPAARSIGLVDPAVRWAGATLYDRGTIAYLAARTHTGEANELGVTAHGPDARELARRTNDLLDHWHRERPAQPTITAYPAGTPGDQRPRVYHIARPDTKLTIAW
jgi:protein-L-isoaspartate(D-aspartate) O-methyltransferase